MITTGNGWTMYRADALAWLHEPPEGLEVDALITDPPYSSGGFTRGDRTLPATLKYRESGAKTEVEGAPPGFDGDNRDQRSFLAWLTLVLSGALPLMRAGAPACVFTDWRQLPITSDAFQAGGLVWRGIAVWTKNGASRPQMGRFRSDAEYVVWGSRGPMPFDTSVGVLPGAWLCSPVHTSERLHLTEKPVEVMEGVVAICPAGGLVLDLFAGAGSTGIAALRKGRRFVGVERDPKYYALAVERLRAEERGLSVEDARAGQMSLLDAQGEHP